MVHGRPAQRVMVGFLADKDPFWHHQVLFMRLDATKWLAVTPEGYAELLNMEEQKAVRLGQARGVHDPRPRRPNTFWQPRQDELIAWGSLKTFVRDASLLADAMEEAECW